MYDPYAVNEALGIIVFVLLPMVVAIIWDSFQKGRR